MNTTSPLDVVSGITQPLSTVRFYKTPWNITHEAANVVASSDCPVHSVHVNDISPAPVVKESQSGRRKRRASHAARSDQSTSDKFR